MRYLVTGATGFVGSHLVRDLLARGHTVAALIRPSTKPWRITELVPRLAVIPGDLESVNRDAILAFRPEAAIHLGWQGVAQGARDDPATLGPNICGSASFASAVADAGCRAFVGVGSQAECGSTVEILNEESPVRPETLYGASKAAARLVLEQICASRAMRFVWLRVLSVYGPQDDAQHLIPYLLRTLLERGRPALTGGDQAWDYLFVSDVVRALYAAADSAEARGTYVLASLAAPKLSAVCTLLRDLIDPSLPLGFGEAPVRGRDLRGDSARFRSATGWEPRVSLEVGLRKTLEAHRNKSEAA